jgi:hypothetical protein
MSTKVRVVASFLVLASFFTFSATADVIYSQGPLDGGSAIVSDFQFFGEQELDDFVLDPGGATITDVHWWGAYGDDPDPTSSDEFTIRFFEESETASGVPLGTYLYEYITSSVDRTATAMTTPGYGAHDGGVVYEYMFYLPTSIVLDGETNYYLSIVNDTESLWGWLQGEDLAGGHWYRTGDESATGTWAPSGIGGDFAFELTGAPIPEPATLLIVGGLSAGLACARKLRKKS